MEYVIFKTYLGTNKTEVVCWGEKDNLQDCRRHWRSYSFGMSDAFSQSGYAKQSVGHIEGQSILIDNLGIEYFCLFGKEGEELKRKLIYGK